MDEVASFPTCTDHKEWILHEMKSANPIDLPLIQNDSEAFIKDRLVRFLRNKMLGNRLYLNHPAYPTLQHQNTDQVPTPTTTDGLNNSTAPSMVEKRALMTRQSDDPILYQTPSDAELGLDGARAAVPYIQDPQFGSLDGLLFDFGDNDFREISPINFSSSNHLDMASQTATGDHPALVSARQTSDRVVGNADNPSVLITMSKPDDPFSSSPDMILLPADELQSGPRSPATRRAHRFWRTRRRAEADMEVGLR